MGQLFSFCCPADDIEEDDQRPLIDSIHQNEDHPPEYIHQEEALKLAVQRACDSFIDINSTTTKISEKLCASDLVRPNPVYLHLPVSNPPLWTDTGVQISELPADDPDSILVTQIMQRVDESFSKFKVNYEGPIVVSFI